MPEEKKIRIRIKDVEEVRCCADLKKFAGRVVIATLLTSGVYLFTFTGSSGLVGMFKETHMIAPHLVDILS